MLKNNNDLDHTFTSIAKRYDLLNTILSANIDKKWRERAIKLAELDSESKLLDLCCGTGKMIDQASKIIGKGTEIIGMDFNQSMLDIAYENLNRTMKSHRYKLIKGDVRSLPFADNSFDRVTIAFGMRNINERELVLSEIFRVLKNNGKLICLELFTPKTPVFKQIYLSYLNYILPLIGFLGTGNFDAYYYLKNSINKFISKDELSHLFKMAGFVNTGFSSLTFGIASIHYGSKL